MITVKEQMSVLITEVNMQMFMLHYIITKTGLCPPILSRFQQTNFIYFQKRTPPPWLQTGRLTQCPTNSVFHYTVFTSISV